VNERPRKGRPVAFTRADGVEPESQAGSVTGLRFTIEARYGGAVLVDLVDLRPRPLAITFAGALRRAAGLGGTLGAASTVKQHVAAYRRFFAYLCEHAPSVRSLADLRASHLDGYEAMLEASGRSPINRHTIIAKPILALRAINAEHPGLLEARLRDRLAYTCARSAGRSRPRDAYSPFVARQLRDAARSDVVALVRRLRAGPLVEGDDRLRRTTAAAHTVIAERGVLTDRDAEYWLLYQARYRRGLSSKALRGSLHGAHHLTAPDVIAFLVLISLETGLEVECIKALEVDCLRNPLAGTVEVAYVKRRARGAEHKRMRVRDRGSTTPGGLIRTVLELTATTRRHHPASGLWVHYNSGKLGHVVRHMRERIDAWTARHGIVDDEGRPLRLLLSRLRKTHKALWYLKSEGHMARFAVGHTREVAARHYADLPSLRPLHEAAVADAFTEAVAVAAPLVLPSDREEDWRAAPILADGRAPPGDVDDLLSGDQDVWLAACAGFYASPYGAPDAPCPQPFWGCLDCSNAVITARKLPAILAFLSFIEGERAGLSASDWQLKFGRAHARIVGQVLPAFSDEVVAEARRAASSQMPYLPPEARA
jgi:hypothetical protein